MKMRMFIMALFCAMQLICVAQNPYKYRYWFDNNDEACVTGESNSGLFRLDIDASELSTGIHVLNFQIINSDTNESATKSMFFYRLSSYENAYAVVSLDGEQKSQYSLEGNNGGFLHFDVDASDIDSGLHSLSLRLIDDSGTSSSSFDSFFMRIPSSQDVSGMRIYYCIDSNKGEKFEAEIVNGFVHADIDLSSVSNGLHLITVLLCNERGLTTQTKSAYFIKEPIGGNGIVSMQHWVNTDANSLKEIIYETPQTYVRFVDLLDLPHYPVKSSSFFFAMENNEPVIYPINTFNIVFKDASGRFISSNRNYTDITMRSPVTDVEELVGLEGSLDFPKSIDNRIHWRKVTLEKGDSIAFQANNVCMIQLFDPTGKELYRASGVKSCRYNGAYAPTDGTYYLAVHDATKKNPDIRLSYKRIDRYTLLEHYPKRVGVFPGCFIISLDGNGYENLNDVVLIRGEKKIYAQEVLSTHKAEAQALFFFDESVDYELGSYSMELSFKDEEGKEGKINVADAITLEEPKFGEFELVARQDRSYHPSLHPKSTCVQFTISGKYTGNVNLQCVPIMIAVDKADNINSISFELEAATDFLDMQKHGAKYIFRTPDLYGKYGDGYMIPLLIPNLQPYGDFETTMEIETPDRTEYNVYTWTGTAWNISSYLNSSNKASGMKYQDEPRPLECYPDACDMIGDLGMDDVYTCICSTYTSLGLTIGGIELATTYNGTRMVCEAAGVDDQWLKENCSQLYERQQRIRRRMVSPHDIVRRTLGHCRPELPNEQLEHIVQSVESVNGLMDALANDDCPTPRHMHAVPVTAVDPNDIYGYVAESGSHYIGKDVARIGYTIEFENDSTLASAAAHRIDIRDTISPQVFNVSDIHTRQIALGNKVVKVDFTGEFITTIDLRPEKNVLAQVSLSVDEANGAIAYEFLSLDPLTVEPVYDNMTGILPINNDRGDGQGHIFFDIDLKDNLADGVIVNNSASIVFDNGEAIKTPVWSNETDYITPTGSINNIEILNDNLINIIIGGEDNRSGIWKYDLYCQRGKDADWILIAKDLRESVFEMTVSDDIDYGFYVLATDKAGNREVKQPKREYSYLNGEVFTGIPTVLIDSLSKEYTIYDMLGRKVIGTPTPGVYIINGKKVILR